MKLSRAVDFFRTDLWRIRPDELSRSKSVLINLVKIVILTFRGLSEDRWMLRASALTFYSLLSIVPALAVIFGVAKGFGFEKTMERILLERLAGQEEIVTWILAFSQKLLQNVKGGLMAGVSMLILFWAIVSLLSHIESAFNNIWGIKRSRGLGRKITDYLALMVICPILFVAASAATVAISSGVQYVVQQISVLSVVSPVIFFGLKILPYLVFWVLFTFLYIFIPNTKVNFRSGALAGLIAGTLYQIFQWVYIYFQVNITSYNTVYGSFAALPLFFIWLQASWLIVLLGAEIASAHQNVKHFEFHPDVRNLSHSFNRLLALRMTQVVVQRFSSGESPLDSETLAGELGLPIPLVNRIFSDLTASGVMSEVKAGEDAADVYQPAVDPDLITVKFVLDALDRGGNDLPLPESRELSEIRRCLQTLDEEVRNSPANLKLKDVGREKPAKPEG